MNFGLVYGQSASGLQRHAETSYGVVLSLEEASRARCCFFEAYSGVSEWQRQQRTRVSRGLAIATPSGRVAHHLQGGAEAVSESATFARRQREALNFPIQGGAAEVMLATLDRLCARLKPLRTMCRLLGVVHDEFLLECSGEQAAERTAVALRRAMEEAWLQVFPAAAPLGQGGVSIGIGITWADLK